MMATGVLVAVAKFHRNTCYSPDLSGEYGALKPDGTFKNDWTTCRSKAEEIVVSSSVVAQSAMNDAPVEYSFNSPTPIPINATDLFLQVVYRGPLGSETDAVVVATKDISEPTYIHNYSRWDQYKYADYQSTAFGTQYTWEQWCLQGYPSQLACNNAMGLTDSVQFSPNATPIEGYDPNVSTIPQSTWTLLVNEPPINPVVKSVAPVGSLTRVAFLTDAVPTNVGVVVTEWLNTAPNTAKIFQWHTGLALASIKWIWPPTHSRRRAVIFLHADSGFQRARTCC